MRSSMSAMVDMLVGPHESLRKQLAECYADQGVLLKVAKVVEETKRDYSKALKGLAAYGFGAGIGAAIGFATRKKLIGPAVGRAYPQITPAQWSALSSGVGAIFGASSTAGFRKIMDMLEKDKKKKDDSAKRIS